MTRLKRQKRSKMGLRKSDRIRCPGHLNWVRSRLACAAQCSPFGPGWDNMKKKIPCGGRMEAHHVRLGAHAGMGQKPGDDRVVALCRNHHSQLDSPGCGQKTFEAIYRVDLAKMAERAWIEDAYHRLRWEEANG